MQNLDLKNKTVFITGVAGFIGSNLAERLLKEIEGIFKTLQYSINWFTFLYCLWTGRETRYGILWIYK